MGANPYPLPSNTPIGYPKWVPHVSPVLRDMGETGPGAPASAL